MSSFLLPKGLTYIHIVLHPLLLCGKTRFGHVFQFDSGSSAGEIVGHAKSLNAVAIRHQRPFRAATAGDDGLVILHSGIFHRGSKRLVLT